jgi:hypothetical protein
MADFRPAEKHGPITEIFPDVFFVTGGHRFSGAMMITKNMFIVRKGGELTIISTMRLSPEGEAELEKLGKVKHVVRIGGFHGADDPYYVHRFSPTFWSPPKLEGVAKKDQTLAPGSSPIDDADVFVFESGAMPEAAIILNREGGVLMTSDSLQNWTTFDGCSFLARAMMPLLGFGPTVIGGPWYKKQGPSIRADFERLAEREFTHVFPGHGTVLKNDAKAGLKKAMAKRLR